MREGESMDGYIYRERARAKAKLNEEKARLSYNANRRQVDKERGTLQDVINEYVGYIDRKVPLTEEEELDRDLAELDKNLEELRQRKSEAELFSTMGDYPIDVENTWDEPIRRVLDGVVEQASIGKGVRHGGNAVPFLEQPWHHYGKMHGRGFLTGQAAKKLEEAASLREGDAFINEMNGAIAYCVMSILLEKERMEDE